MEREDGIIEERRWEGLPISCPSFLTNRRPCRLVVFVTELTLADHVSPVYVIRFFLPFRLHRMHRIRRTAVYEEATKSTLRTRLLTADDVSTDVDILALQRYDVSCQIFSLEE